ncbi:MAG: methionyl-tRNA formyltransferase [Bacteroidales bacterium]|nr:methionyl-tRNA formyltransferase [Bacteroidales bacterium]
MRIVFMGTPEFAVATLDAICKAGHDVAAVVTVPDKPAGRGLQLRPSAVKEYAVAHNLPVLQPEKLKSEDFLAQLREINADVFVVVAFRMLPEVVYEMPKYGTFNVHASLLPNYRGAAPIHHAVMNGETKSGVTTFFLDHQIDTGDIIDSIEVPIRPDETTGELYDELMQRGAELAVRTLQSISDGTVTTRPQPQLPADQLKPAPKIFKEDTYIDWNRPTVEVYNKIRGLCPSPCACTRIRNKKGNEEQIKLFEARAVFPENRGGKPGTVRIKLPDTFAILTSDGEILIQKLQWQGKSRLEIEAFLRGFHPENYDLEVF